MSKRKIAAVYLPLLIALIGAVVTVSGYLLNHYRDVSERQKQRQNDLLLKLIQDDPVKSSQNLLWAYEAKLLPLSNDVAQRLRAYHLPSDIPNNANSNDQSVNTLQPSIVTPIYNYMINKEIIVDHNRLKETKKLNQAAVNFYIYLATAYAQDGRIDEAIALVQQAQTIAMETLDLDDMLIPQLDAMYRKLLQSQTEQTTYQTQSTPIATPIE